MIISQTRLPTLYISHGAGPCFFMDMGPPFSSNEFDKLAAYLRGINATLPVRPKAILVISAHWQDKLPTVGSNAKPQLIFDYYGFPANTYQLRYPAPGAPELAGRVRNLLGAAGIGTADDPERGFDHGVFVPFLLMYPDADLPIVELSLQQKLDASEHLAIGRALVDLRDEGVLIVGSGMSYHNLSQFFNGSGEAAGEFDKWLVDTAIDSDPTSRNQKLSNWQMAPFARTCHPHEDHLIPLMVVAGAAGVECGRQVYSDTILGKAVSGFQFG